MKTTTKKHWVNGYQTRGGYHKTLALQFFNIGILIAWTKMPNKYSERKLSIELFKLI